MTLRTASSTLLPYTTLFRSLTLTLNSLCQGITLDHARTAGEAMEQVSRHTYDLILLDLHLPDGNGLHLLKKLHAVDPLTDRKSTRLNSSHVKISYAVFCLKK